MNNLKKIKKYLVFDSDDDFFFLQILRRKKENPDMTTNKKVIKNYYINSIEYLDNKMDEIIKLCNYFNARAYLRLNKRSYEKCSFQLLKHITDQIINKDFSHCKNAFDRVCGRFHNQKLKRWIVDIDEPLSMGLIKKYSHYINIKISPQTDKVLGYIPTKNGFHLICNPFNVQEFKKLYPDVEIHKDNPTILYYK